MLAGACVDGLDEHAERKELGYVLSGGVVERQHCSVDPWIGTLDAGQAEAARQTDRHFGRQSGRQLTSRFDASATPLPGSDRCVGQADRATNATTNWEGPRHAKATLVARGSASSDRCSPPSLLEHTLNEYSTVLHLETTD